MVTDLTALWSNHKATLKHYTFSKKLSPAGNWLWAYLSNKGEHVLLRNSTLKLLPTG